LVDRLWPRGLSKERAAVKLWLKEVAPSTELRKWFSHDPAKWKEFQMRYRKELRDHNDALKSLKQQSKEHLTLASRPMTSTPACTTRRRPSRHVRGLSPAGGDWLANWLPWPSPDSLFSSVRRRRRRTLAATGSRGGRLAS
jgi:uncharacterized protein YeaO (DUF488 family)